MLGDPAQARAVVTRLTDRHEAGRIDLWSVDGAPPDCPASTLREIVCFRRSIDGLRRDGGAAAVAPADRKDAGRRDA